MDGIIANCRNTDGSRATTGLLVLQAVRAKKIFVFGELLALPAVQKLRGEPEFALLELFAYGTYAEYASRRGEFEAGKCALATPQQEHKLRQLTVLSLASHKKRLSYEEVARATGLQLLTGASEVEALVIQCVYDGLLKATCNPKLQCFVVHWSAARDVRQQQTAAGSSDDDLGDVVRKLDAWLANSQLVVRRIDEAVHAYARERQAERDFHHTVRAEAEARKMEAAGGGGGGSRRQ